MIVISGANGAGKSTLAPHLLRDTLGIYEYVNADTIALGLSAFAPEHAALEAGRIMLRRLNYLVAQRKDFAFETTLASRFYARWLKGLQADGYKINLIFLWLQSVDLAIERVRERVRLGGHSVPEETIKRRYIKGLRNFFELYQSFANSWRVYEVSLSTPIVVAFGSKESGATVIEEDIWKKIQAAAR